MNLLKSSNQSLLLAVATLCLSSLSTATELKPLTKELRNDYLSRAQVWSDPGDISAKDLGRGPTGPGSYAPDEDVTCQFVKKKMGGMTPKFSCQIGDEKPFKVKYGLPQHGLFSSKSYVTNGEIYGGLVSSRLFWALGFNTDDNYIERVTCENCYPNPWPDYVKSGRQGLFAKPQKEVVFYPALINRKHPGKKMEMTTDQGWSFKELTLVDQSRGGASSKEIEAFKLLAAWIKHGDNGHRNQKLICDKGQVNASGICEKPLLLISDLGATFGSFDGAILLNVDAVSKFNIKTWMRSPTWRDLRHCQVNLKDFGYWTGSVPYYTVTREGQKFLASLMSQLTEAQILDLFRAAKPELKDGTTAEAWTEAFLKKRHEITDTLCGQE